MRRIGFIPARGLPSATLGLRISEMRRLGFDRVIVHDPDDARYARQFQTVEIVASEDAANAVSGESYATVVVNSRDKLDAESMTALGTPGELETRCLAGTAGAPSFARYDRRRGVHRYSRGDSGDAAVEVPDMRGPVAVLAGTFAMLCDGSGAGWTYSGREYAGAARAHGVRTTCSDPVASGVRWHVGTVLGHVPHDEKTKAPPVDTAKRVVCTNARPPAPRGGGRTIVGLASYPARESGMLSVVAALAPQCDEMHVALNEYSENDVNRVRRLAPYDNVVFTRYTGIDDLGCQNKFREVGRCGQDDYFLTVDDDIIYPSNYVEKMVRFCDSKGGMVAMSCHGIVFSSNESGDLAFHGERERMYVFSSTVDGIHGVHKIGCGAAIFMPRRIGLSFSVFEAPKNTGDDELFAVFAQRNGIPSAVVPHRSWWLSANKSMDIASMWKDPESVFRREEFLSGQGIRWRILYDERHGDRKAFFKIVVPVFRSCESLKRALRSVAAQTFDDYVVVVCDDASPADMRNDNERSVREILGKRGEFVGLVKKAFAGGARNAAMDAGPKSRYVMFLDADDELVSESVLSGIHDFIKRNGSPDVVLLPFIRGTDSSSLRVMQGIRTPEKLAEGRYVQPWAKCIRSDKVCRFDEGLRRANDVTQHFKTADCVSTVAPYDSLVVRYNFDGETSMFGENRGSNEADVLALESFFRVCANLLSTKWKHEYMRSPIASQVMMIHGRMIPRLLAKYDGSLRNRIMVEQ